MAKDRGRSQLQIGPPVKPEGQRSVVLAGFFFSRFPSGLTGGSMGIAEIYSLDAFRTVAPARSIGA